MNRPPFLNTRNTPLLFAAPKSGRSLIQVGFLLSKVSSSMKPRSCTLATRYASRGIGLQFSCRCDHWLAKVQTEHISCSSLDKHSTEASLAASAIQYLRGLPRFHMPQTLAGPANPIRVGVKRPSLASLIQACNSSKPLSLEIIPIHHDCDFSSKTTDSRPLNGCIASSPCFGTITVA